MKALIRLMLALALGATSLLAGCAMVPAQGDDTGTLGATPQDSLAADYVGMGVEYLKRGQPAVALQRLKRGQELDPNYAPVYNVLAIVYGQLGETDLARENFERASSMAPKDPYVHNAYGSFLCNQKQYGAADEQFQAALHNPLYETPWIAITNAGTCARRAGDAPKAEGYFRQALTANPRFGPALYQMAELSYAQHDLATAKGYIERLLSVAQPTPETLALAVRVERGLGSKTQAKRYERMLREKFPDSPEILQLNNP